MNYPTLHERSSQFSKSLKKLNKQLTGKLRLEVKPEADYTPVKQFLLDCKLENVGEGTSCLVKRCWMIFLQLD